MRRNSPSQLQRFRTSILSEEFQQTGDNLSLEEAISSVLNGTPNGGFNSLVFLGFDNNQLSSLIGDSLREDFEEKINLIFVAGRGERDSIQNTILAFSRSNNDFYSLKNSPLCNQQSRFNGFLRCGAKYGWIYNGITEELSMSNLNDCLDDIYISFQTILNTATVGKGTYKDAVKLYEDYIRKNGFNASVNNMISIINDLNIRYQKSGWIPTQLKSYGGRGNSFQNYELFVQLSKEDASSLISDINENFANAFNGISLGSIKASYFIGKGLINSVLGIIDPKLKDKTEKYITKSIGQDEFTHEMNILNTLKLKDIGVYIYKVKNPKHQLFENHTFGNLVEFLRNHGKDNTNPNLKPLDTTLRKYYSEQESIITGWEKDESLVGVLKKIEGIKKIKVDEGTVVTRPEYYYSAPPRPNADIGEYLIWIPLRYFP